MKLKAFFAEAIIVLEEAEMQQFSTWAEAKRQRTSVTSQKGAKASRASAECATSYKMSVESKKGKKGRAPILEKCTKSIHQRHHHPTDQFARYGLHSKQQLFALLSFAII